MAFLHLNIRGRLILGFSVLCALLAGVVGVTIIKVRVVNDSTDRTVNLRVPTAMTASDLVSGVYASLASLRGNSATSLPSCTTSTRSAIPSTSGSSEEIISTPIPACTS